MRALGLRALDRCHGNVAAVGFRSPPVREIVMKGARADRRFCGGRSRLVKEIPLRLDDGAP
jgi:hypothetical protein